MELELRVIGHRDLLPLVQAIAARPDCFPVVPIDPARAGLHAANPVADPGDPALLLVLAGEACLGYMGLMPQFYCSGGQACKVFAITTLFLAPELRGRRVADLFIERARQAGPLITVGNSKAAQGFFRKKGLREWPAYRSVYLPLGAGMSLQRLVNSAKKRLGSRHHPGAWQHVSMPNAVASVLTGGSRRKAIDHFLQSVAIPPGRSFDVCQALPDGADWPVVQSEGRIVWDTEGFNWLLSATAAAKPRSPIWSRYHFAAQDPGNRPHAVTLSLAGKVCGGALFRRHRIQGQTTLSIMHAIIPDDGWRPLVVAAALALAKDAGADLVRAGVEFEQALRELGGGRVQAGRLRHTFTDDAAATGVFDHYQEAFADGDIAIY